MPDEDLHTSVSKTYHQMNTWAQMKIQNINTCQLPMSCEKLSQEALLLNTVYAAS